LKSVKETVEYVATKLGEIEDYIYRKDKQKLDRVKIKRLRRKAKKQ
jgi:hypothetical protein